MKQNILKLMMGLLLSHTLLMAKSNTFSQVSDNSKVKILTKKNVKSIINTKDKLVVVKFFATWCRPCTKMKPEFKQASRSLQKKVVYASVDVDNLGSFTKNMGVGSIPTTIIFKNGKEIARKLSAMKKTEILTWINAYL